MFHTRSFVLFALLLTLAPSSALALTANRVGFQPTSTGVASGQTFAVTLVGRGFDHVTEGGGVNLQFDPARLKVLSVTVNATTWEFFTQPGTINNTSGTVTDLLFASFVGHSGDFEIATITFQALATGSVAVQLSQSAQNPFASGGQVLPVVFEPATVAVSAAPAPVPGGAALALALALGCAGFVTVRRKAGAALAHAEGSR